MLQNLREKRTKAINQLEGLFETDDQGNLDDSDVWDSAKTNQYDNLCTEVKDLDTQIKRYEDMVDLIGQEARDKGVQQHADVHGISTDEAEAKITKIRNAYGNWMRRGERGLSQDDWDVLATIPEAVGPEGDEAGRRPQGANPPTKPIRRSGTDAQGGYTVPDELSSEILGKLKEFGGMRSVATVSSSETGRKVNWPTSDASSEEGEIVAENTDVSDSEITFGTKAIEFDWYSSKTVAVSREWLMDTNTNDVVSYLFGRLSTRIARIQNKFFTLGSSTAGHKVSGVVEGLGVRVYRIELHEAGHYNPSGFS